MTYSADPIGAGNYSVTISIQADDPQYTGSTTLSFSIAPKPVTVTALDRDIRAGETVPDLSAPAAGVDYRVEGLLSTDSLGGMIAMSYQKGGEAVMPDTSAPGSYDIVITCTGANANYTVSCVNGKLTVSDHSSNPVVVPVAHDVIVRETAHGAVTAAPRSASQGLAVSVTVYPDEVYELAGLTATDERGSAVPLRAAGAGVYTFTMPDSDVTVTAVFRAGAGACDRGPACPLWAFNDLDAYAWYHDGIHYCLENGLMDGVDSALFVPDASVTRAMLVTILWRAAGEPVVNYAMPFTDVYGGAWYAEAVRWAASQGIVTGVTDTSFAPDQAITREQLAAILYRCAQAQGLNVSAGEETNILSYADFAQISEYAIPAMQWACGEGIVTGVTESTLAPQGTATRAQAATMLMRFMGNAE